MGDESREQQKVRVRGIYATALTRYLSEAFDVVDPSETIRRRFEDHEFGEGDPDVLIEATDDDIGVRVTDARPTEGSSESAAEEVSRLLDELGEDAFVFEGGAQEGAVFDSVVDETLGGGAVVDLGEREAYLPYSKAESRIDEGDEVRVQVVDPAAPWDEELPVVAEGIRVSVGPATLVRGASGTDVLGGDDERSLQLERTTEMVSVEVPEDWGVRYERRAARLDVAEVESALEEAVERAESADDRIESRDRRDEEGDAGEVIAPREAFWVYLGREARFELDEERRSVETTIHGHHRVKAHHEDAGAGVDIAESVCDDPKERLPFGVLVRRFGPGEGSRVELRHGKPDGSFVSLGEGEVVSVDSDEGEVRVRREMSSEGRYDALGTEKEKGDTATTSFVEGRWWYPTVYRSEDREKKGVYANICTPLEILSDEVRYVDLHVDVVKLPGEEPKRVDEDELEGSVEDGELTESVAEKAREVASEVEGRLSDG